MRYDLYAALTFIIQQEDDDFLYDGKSIALLEDKNFRDVIAEVERLGRE